jgi:CheY-like chemotaxis protein
MNRPRQKRGNVENPLAVLIVEDSESDAQLINRLLTKADYKVVFERVETAGQVDAALEKLAWDIVISDYSPPQFNESFKRETCNAQNDVAVIAWHNTKMFLTQINFSPYRRANK